jgi:hypothetical protein
MPVYTVYFNLHHSQAGHLMQGRYGARLVEGDGYLLKLSRYVHLNPVFVAKWRNASLAERRQALRNYPWSSYREYAGLVAPIGFLETGPLLCLANRFSTGAASQAYACYVEGGMRNSGISSAPPAGA